MFKKESINTAKTLGVSLLVSMLIISVAFFILKITNLYKISFSEILFSLSEAIFLLIAAYLGAGIFGEEKKHGSFEYLFSLKYSRMQLLKNKLIPRIMALGVLILLYYSMMFISTESIFMKSSNFLPILFTVFLFFTSLSLLNENNTLNTIYNIIIFVLLIGAFSLTASFFTNMTLNSYYFKIIYLAEYLFILLTVIMFIIFVLSFKNIDLSNHNFGFMKKNLKRLGIFFIIFISLYTLINQFDSSKNLNDFSKKDLLPARFETNDGFYRFLTIFEPANIDIDSKNTINKYRFLFDPEFNKSINKKKWDFLFFKNNSAPYVKILDQYYSSEQSKWIEWPQRMPTESWSKTIVSKKKSIQKIISKLDTPLIRYQKMVSSSSYIDFSTLRKDIIPWNHSWLLRTISKIYISKYMLDCLEGNWNRGMTALLKHLSFYKKVIKRSRSLFINNMAKDSMQFTLRAIADLMSYSECPKEIYKQVYDNMPNLQYEHYGSKNAIIANHLSIINYMQKYIKEDINNNISYFLYRLFLQKNRTMKYLNKQTIERLEIDKQHPYLSQNKWKKLYEDYRNIKGYLWWVFNPSGKIVLTAKGYPFSSYRTYRLKALYDMTKISAELRLNYNNNKPVSTILKNLKSYKALTDPYSGKAYKFNTKNKVLYSFGPDLVDNNGSRRLEWSKDIFLPLVFRNNE